MRAILLSALALGALTSAALAEQPLLLTDGQMDKVTAGGPSIGIRLGGPFGAAPQAVGLHTKAFPAVVEGALDNSPVVNGVQSFTSGKPPSRP